MNTLTQVLDEVPTVESQPTPNSPQRPVSKLGTLTRWLLVAVVSLIGLQPPSAGASLCVVPSVNGNWVNVNPNTRSITRANVRMECRSRFVTRCVGSICTGYWVSEPHYFIRLYGKCHPTDCDWSQVEGRALTGSMAGWYYFYYNQGFAKRHVYVRTYPQYPGRMRVWIYNDFVDPNRPDYTTDEWFRH